MEFDLHLSKQRKKGKQFQYQGSNTLNDSKSAARHQHYATRRSMQGPGYGSYSQWALSGSTQRIYRHSHHRVHPIADTADEIILCRSHRRDHKRQRNTQSPTFKS